MPTGNIVARALRDNNMIVHIHNLNHNMIEKSETDESEMFFSHWGVSELHVYPGYSTCRKIKVQVMVQGAQ